MKDKYEVVEVGGCPIGVGEVQDTGYDGITAHKMICNTVFERDTDSDMSVITARSEMIANALNNQDRIRDRVVELRDEAKDQSENCTHGRIPGISPQSLTAGANARYNVCKKILNIIDNAEDTHDEVSTD